MKVLLIRHGQTQGNKEKRYVGSTDEELLPESIELLSKFQYPNADALYVSPKIRCIQTANTIYPDMLPTIVEDFTECNFGNFEYKNYLELAEDEDYQKWIDSNGEMPFPNGESRDEFQRRCVNAFEQVVSQAIQKDLKSIALVVHGGTIMSILDKYSNPHKDYFNWQVGNGEGYQAEINISKWIFGEKEIDNIRRMK